MIPAFNLLNDGIEELEDYAEVCGLIDEHQPSALVLMVDPRSNPNCQARIVGDPDLLVQVLLFALRDPANAEFARAFREGVPVREIFY